MSNIIYQTKRLLVSDTLFRTPRRSYRIRDIEKLSIKRGYFWFSIPVSAACYFLVTEYYPYLYGYEVNICIALGLSIPIATWFIGTLSVTSKAFNNDDAITGFIPNLQKARQAIEQVIFNSENSKKENHHV